VLGMLSHFSDYGSFLAHEKPVKPSQGHTKIRQILFIC